MNLNIHAVDPEVIAAFRVLAAQRRVKHADMLAQLVLQATEER